MTREALLASIAANLLRLLFSTIRLKVHDRSGLTQKRFAGPVILCFWHNRILGITVSFLRRYPAERRGVTVLTSPSRDGEILAQCVRNLGMEAVRGSSSRRGSQALRELVSIIEKGGDIAITPDGPRGPRYSLGPGAILLSQTTGTPLLPMHAKFSRCVRLKSWDGFIIPLPFSTISVSLSEPITVPKDSDANAFEQYRVQLETILRNEAD